jgi:hypothetical protein
MPRWMVCRHLRFRARHNSRSGVPLLELQRCRALPAYTDVIGKVTGTFVYKVCVASTTTCSANSSVTF